MVHTVQEPDPEEWSIMIRCNIIYYSTIAEDLDLANRASFQNIVLEEAHDGEQCGNIGVACTAVFIQLNTKYTAVFIIQQI